MATPEYLMHRQIPGETGRPTGKHTLNLCSSTFLHRDWSSLWGYRIHIKDVQKGEASTARDEIILMHETVGYLAANLYEMSLRLNDLGGSNQIVYTAYCLGFWIYRWWHLIQYKGDLVINRSKLLKGGDKEWHEQGCHCDFCRNIEKEAHLFLQKKVIPYFTTLKYDDIDGQVKLQFAQKRPIRHQIAARQLFEPGYDAYQNEGFAVLDNKGDVGDRQFDKHLQICSICIRKEVLQLANAIQTMFLIRHRPVFQSLRAVLRQTYEAYPLLENAQKAPKSFLGMMKIPPPGAIDVVHGPTLEPEAGTRATARAITEHYANCLERIATINETSLDRAKQAQDGTEKLFQTEGTGLILTTAASAIGLLGNMDRDLALQHAPLLAITFGLFTCSTLLSLWASMLYLASAVRLVHPFSRPYIKQGYFYHWCFLYLIHWDSLTRFILAVSFISLSTGFLCFSQVYYIGNIDMPRAAANNTPNMTVLTSDMTAKRIKLAPTIIVALAFAQLLSRALWHYVWEYAYGWRVWRRYKAAMEGNDTVEENRFRHHHVFIEVLYFFARDHIYPVIKPIYKVFSRSNKVQGGLP